MNSKSRQKDNLLKPTILSLLKRKIHNLKQQINYNTGLYSSSASISSPSIYQFWWGIHWPNCIHVNWINYTKINILYLIYMLYFFNLILTLNLNSWVTKGSCCFHVRNKWMDLWVDKLSTLSSQWCDQMADCQRKPESLQKGDN